MQGIATEHRSLASAVGDHLSEPDGTDSRRR